MDIIYNIRTEALINILEYHQAKRLGLILAVDSNAHSTLWGMILTEVISEYGLLLRNIGKEYTSARGVGNRPNLNLQPRSRNPRLEGKQSAKLL